MSRPLFAGALALALVGCPSAILDDPGPTVLGDDDDSAGDDDDSAAGDDDDSAGDEVIDPKSEAFVDKRYCLDWDSVVLNEPAGGNRVLDITGLSDFPMLLQPAGTDLEAGTIDMVLGMATGFECEQNLDVDVVNLTEDAAGSYAPPSFSLGPLDFELGGGDFVFAALDVVVTGTFTADAAGIIRSDLVGMLDVSQYEEFCGFPLTCFKCPEDEDRQCVSLDARDAVFFDSELGPLQL